MGIDVRAALRVAWRALARNKMRTLLTMMGVIIGVGAVICTVAIGEGGSAQIREQLNNLGDSLVWVEAGGRNLQGVRTGNGATKTLRLEDAWAIRDSIPLIKSVSPNVDSHVQVVYGNQNWYTTYRGVSPEYLRIRRWQVAAGVGFSQKEVESLANVCLLGQTVAERLFGGEDPLGKTIRIQALPFLVIGILAPKGQSTFGMDQDDTIMMPYTTAMHKVRGVDWLDDILCSAVSAQAIRPAEEQVTRLLRQRHRLRPDQPDDFNIRHPEDILQAQEQATRTFTLMLASIASVSLLVGGIGIMNIMLASILERTREIGVRRAVGARQSDIIRQFVVEAVLISFMGGSFGIVFGFLMSRLIALLAGWSTIVTASSILLAFLVSITVGLVFGIYPAVKAARLDPVEAIRYE
jgi:putative ABC transport system permease protein